MHLSFFCLRSLVLLASFCVRKAPSLISTTRHRPDLRFDTQNFNGFTNSEDDDDMTIVGNHHVFVTGVTVTVTVFDFVHRTTVKP
jgi:hypothetical protein